MTDLLQEVFDVFKNFWLSIIKPKLSEIALFLKNLMEWVQVRSGVTLTW